jgi:ABC-type uncharacterized transport system permease subunit
MAGRKVVLIMFLAGALAGLAATHYVLGRGIDEYRLKQSLPYSVGFDGIAVALMGQNTPVGVGLAAWLFGILLTGGLQVNLQLGISRELVAVLQALVVLFIAAGGFLPRYFTDPLRAAEVELKEETSGRAKDEPGRGLLDGPLPLHPAADHPLLFTALGGMFSERSGVTNIALEGIILFGALTAAVVVERFEAALGPGPHPWLPWVGVLSAILVGGLVAAVHAMVSIKYRADQIISATAINLLALGAPSLVLTYFYGNATNSQEVVNRLPLLLGLSPLVYLAFLLVPVAWWVLFKTPFGLRLRAVGEHPEAADTLGVNVYRLRYTGVILSGVLAGLAGAYLSIGFLNQFVRGMSAGMGFIALAAMIFGNWHPLGILFSTLLFGFASALAIQLQGTEILPAVLVQAFPYVVTVLVLAGFIGRSRPPAAVGKPYEK